MDLGKVYFVNASPTQLKLTLNGGPRKVIEPMSVNDNGTAVTGPAHKYNIGTNMAEDVFGANHNPNEITVRTELTGTTNIYTIRSTYPGTHDLYFFMFEGSVVGEDQDGESDDIKIEKYDKNTVLSLAKTLNRDET